LKVVIKDVDKVRCFRVYAEGAIPQQGEAYLEGAN
jgi:hypothetical protein